MGNFLRNYWYVGATSDELHNSPIGKTLLNEPVVFFRGKNGIAGALVDSCAHRLTPLSKGRIEGNTLECGYHGWAYNNLGKCVHLPGVENPKNIKIKSYPIQEKWGWVFIWMGNPSLASKTSLPDFHVMSETKWVGDGSMLKVNANCDLIRDNLLDLTHAKYTHRQTLATDEIDKVPVLAKKLKGKVTVERVMKDIRPSPFFSRTVGYKANIIHRQKTEFTPACNIVIRLRGNSMPNSSENLKNGFRVINAMTPETDTSTLYYWWLGRDFDQGNTKLTQWMKDGNARTFLEDKTILEAQQKNMLRNPEQRPIPSPVDKSIALAETLTKELLLKETSH
ncbi:MAG: aromatic ring-hydroxylating dioxygenase subunit alpha [Pseudomonadota bacterium]|nr:aromatic ring-hydroxylating dioxygenase subunit alpha [Pseudomonadota bacterium]